MIIYFNVPIASLRVMLMKLNSNQELLSQSQPCSNCFDLSPSLALTHNLEGDNPLQVTVPVSRFLSIPTNSARAKHQIVTPIVEGAFSSSPQLPPSSSALVSGHRPSSFKSLFSLHLAAAAGALRHRWQLWQGLFGRFAVGSAQVGGQTTVERW